LLWRGLGRLLCRLLWSLLDALWWLLGWLLSHLRWLLLNLATGLWAGPLLTALFHPRDLFLYHLAL
jgi:hypothetical protein